MNVAQAMYLFILNEVTLVHGEEAVTVTVLSKIFPCGRGLEDRAW